MYVLQILYSGTVFAAVHACRVSTAMLRMNDYLTMIYQLARSHYRSLNGQGETRTQLHDMGDSLFGALMDRMSDVGIIT